MNRSQQNVWRKLANEAPIRSMNEVIEEMTTFIDTYPSNRKYDAEMPDETFIDDILYGLGKSLNADEYSFRNGYIKFKKHLLKHLIATTPEIENEQTG